MARRPVFLPIYQKNDAPPLTAETSFDIPWATGFARIQKEKNIKSLHAAAEAQGIYPILEVSTKSDAPVGRHLSSFNLQVLYNKKKIPLESAFQGSKEFENGGPYNDIYLMEARDAKRDPRLQQSGAIRAFTYDNYKFPTFPQTAFYDWLYLTALQPHSGWIRENMLNKKRYAGFTDIEFNPQKSLNCQARSCALLVSLIYRDLLDEVLESPSTFIKHMMKYSNKSQSNYSAKKQTDFNSLLR